MGGGQLDALLTSCAAPLSLQALEVEAGVSRADLWREAVLLRQCTHARIVPLYGVATQVGALSACAMHSASGSCTALHCTALSGESWQKAALDLLLCHVDGRRMALQGNLLLMATRFMRGGTLKAALTDLEARQHLRWHARWVG